VVNVHPRTSKISRSSQYDRGKISIKCNSPHPPKTLFFDKHHYKHVRRERDASYINMQGGAVTKRNTKEMK
jgi:hypothetical protein